MLAQYSNLERTKDIYESSSWISPQEPKGIINFICDAIDMSAPTKFLC